MLSSGHVLLFVSKSVAILLRSVCLVFVLLILCLYMVCVMFKIIKLFQPCQMSNHFLCHVLLFLRKKIQYNNPNKYFDLPYLHLYIRCFQYQICGHYAWNFKHHFFPPMCFDMMNVCIVCNLLIS